MLKDLFGKRPTTKGDVILAVVGACMAVFKAVDVYKEYKAEQEQAQYDNLNKENEQ